MFFKIFLLVVSFGLFHGLFFLPVILSLMGPAGHGLTESDDEVTPIKVMPEARPKSAED
jgi:Niemann-Pick C1 protein